MHAPPGVTGESAEGDRGDVGMAGLGEGRCPGTHVALIAVAGSDAAGGNHSPSILTCGYCNLVNSVAFHEPFRELGRSIREEVLNFMGKFFSGWRRKAGLLVLAVALVLSGAWVRSLYVSDFIRITKYKVHIAAVSGSGKLKLMVDAAPDSPGPGFAWHSQIDGQNLTMKIHDDVWLRQMPGRLEQLEIVERSIVAKMERSTPTATAQLEKALFTVREEINRLKNTFRISAQYWLIVGPLVLLSALLMFLPLPPSPRNGRSFTADQLQA